MKIYSLISFVGATMASFVLSALMEPLTGRVEPWDTSFGMTLYVTSCFFIGFIGQWLSKARGTILLLFLGVWAGQNVFIALLGSGEAKAWWMLGVFVTFFASVPSVLGSVAANLMKKWRHTTPQA